jgi:hypothetical protein
VINTGTTTNAIEGTNNHKIACFTDEGLKKDFVLVG